MRRNTDVTKIVLNWKLEGKKPRGRTRKGWMYVVKKDLEGDKWSDLVIVVKTLGEL